MPVRTFTEWDDVLPGFAETDLVAHCGTSTQGAYLRSLVLTDVATGWTECLYRAVRLYVNFFQPSMKLTAKRRTGSRVHRTYNRAQTPYRRVLASGVLSPEKANHLEQVSQALDPVRLLDQVKRLQDSLWQHAAEKPPTESSDPSDETIAMIARFDADACMPDGAAGTTDDTLPNGPPTPR